MAMNHDSVVACTEVCKSTSMREQIMVLRHYLGENIGDAAN